MKHKYLILIILTYLTLLFPTKASCHKFDLKINKNECKTREYKQSEITSQIVYICTGNYAYAYHSRSDCPGLNNCKGQIQYTDENTALNQYGRKPCCRCWMNVGSNCHDDNPNNNTSGGYGGGGESSKDNTEAQTVVALAIVTVGAIVLSNDFYVYPTYSFYKGNTYNGMNHEFENGNGWVFGFRKTFEHSALEYGASCINFTNNNNNYTYNNTYEEDSKQWGGHFNFAHQIFYNKTPDWLKVYLGPSVNYVFDLGYGGLAGIEIRLFNRLKFDIRYEYTTQTNQIQAGLIFNYQREYFWNK
jgi:hypothetical protein